MKEITISLFHKGCFASESTKKMFGVKLIFIGQYVLKKETKKSISSQGLWKIEAQQQDIDKFIRILRNEKTIKQMEIIHKSMHEAFIFLRWKLENSAYNKAISSGCVPFGPMVVENGIETFSLIAEEEKTISKYLSALKKDMDYNIVKIGEIETKENRFNLTEKQKRALQIALAYSYYTWPRKVKISELAEVMKISRKVFQDHLRKAESKIFPELIKNAISEV